MLQFEKIKSIIEKEYECHSSLYLQGGMRRHNVAYFYNMEEFQEWLERVEAAQSILAYSDLEGGIDYKEDLGSMSKCLIRCKEIEKKPHKYLLLDVYYVEGIKLSFFKKRKSIKLVPFCESSFRMKIRDDGEIYTGGERLFAVTHQYYENLELGQHGKIKRIFSKILDQIGRETPSTCAGSFSS